ncbi:uncharacterized protein LOC143460364 [Clavelina lepadiformis]|uniref:uncharacterized protein LOC143460364 n=1 Tax=Clavelina lepadiformis TaxID=159417 RepID=UPI004042CA51
MRGTSTDLSRYGEEYEHVFKSTIAGVTIQAPQLLQIKVDVQNLEKDDLSHLFLSRFALFLLTVEYVVLFYLISMTVEHFHHSLTSTQSQQGLVYAIFPVGIVCCQPKSSLNLLGPTQASLASVRGFANCDANLCLEMLLPEQMLYDRCQVISMEVISTLASISLRTCQVIHGPAIIIDKNSTILVESDCKAEMTKKGDVTIMVGKGKPKHIGKELNAIQLSIFSHRFTSIAEQMGRILQRTAIPSYPLTLRNDLTSRALFSDPMVVLFPTFLTSQAV